MSARLYVAYGSNLNVSRMRWRCPDARIVGTALIRGYELLFKGSRTGAYLTLGEKEGGMVPAAVWAVSARDEAALDRYEGFPEFYYKKDLVLPRIETGGTTFRNRKAFVYIMHEERLPGMPAESYVRTCLTGYRDFGFDERILLDAVRRTGRLCHEEKRTG